MNNRQTPKKENFLASVMVSIVIPAVILSKWADEAHLGVLTGFLIALAFPIGQALYNIIVRKEAGFVALLGLVSIFLTGIIKVMELPTEWLAYKEAAVPLLIGTAVIVSLRTPYPLVKKLLFNDQLFNLELIDTKLAEKGNTRRFEQALRTATWLVGASFLVSTVLNFTLTRYIVTAEAGTAEFNAQVGHLTAISYPAIALPSTLVMLIAVWYLFRQLKKLTGEDVEQLFSEQLKDKAK
ncbi:MAG: hypothetical protein J6Z12_02725 [Paludibacteraceae bacterium]|nr:hypothetical protein [Paludibacteraceae bacterium]